MRNFIRADTHMVSSVEGRFSWVVLPNYGNVLCILTSKYPSHHPRASIISSLPFCFFLSHLCRYQNLTVIALRYVCRINLLVEYWISSLCKHGRKTPPVDRG